jgi:hypothetical protein
MVLIKGRIGREMNAQERKELGEEILTVMCKGLDFSLDKSLPNIYALSILLPQKDVTLLIEAVLDLGRESYLTFKEIPRSGKMMPYDLRVTRSGRNLVEKILQDDKNSPCPLL